MAAEAPSAVIIRIPAALGSFSQEQDQHFVLDFAHGLAAALHRETGGGNGDGENALLKVTEGENRPVILFPGPIAFPPASYHHSSFFPFSSVGTLLFRSHPSRAFRQSNTGIG